MGKTKGEETGSKRRLTVRRLEKLDAPNSLTFVVVLFARVVDLGVCVKA